MLSNRFTVVFLFCLFGCFSTSSFALSVTFINPGFANTNSQINKTGNFWHKVSQVMQNTADDLNISLHVHYANRNHIMMKELIIDAIKAKPDFLILVDEKSVVSDFLRTINTQNIPIYFLLNSPLNQKLAALKSRSVNISGSVIPNNVDAGRALATSLVNIHKKQSNETVNMLALLGDHVTPASVERTQGLMHFLENNPAVNLVSTEYAYWSTTQSYTKTLAFLSLAPEINVIWCANDAIAFGAIDALKSVKRRRNVVVGGINWDQPIDTQSILDESYGGHVLLGAYALLAIFNHSTYNTPLEHQQLMIFEPYSKQLKPLIDAINSSGLAAIDFTKFTMQNSQPLNFTIINLAREFTSSL